MARPPDVQTFKRWFTQTEKESLPILVKDFANGKLKNTLLFKGYRKGAKLLKQNVKTTPLPKINSAYADLDCLTNPHTIDTVTNAIARDEFVEGNIKLDLIDAVECGNELELKALLADMLVGTREFKKLDDAIDYVFIGGDSDGLYFSVKCYDVPVTEEMDE